MTASATELTNELVQLQSDYRAFTLSPDYRFDEVWNPTPGGFAERYQERTKEIQRAIAGLR